MTVSLPEVICTIGVHGSASTWLYNIVREMVTFAAGPDRVMGRYADKLEHLPSPEERGGKLLIVKSHIGSGELEEWLDEQGCLRFLSVRDPRDGVVSLVQRFNYALPSANEMVEVVCARIQKLAADGHPLYRYEDRFFEHPATLDEIEAQLGLNLPPEVKADIFARYQADAVRAFARTLENLPKDRRFDAGGHTADRLTQIHGPHVGEGVSGKWRLMPPEVLDHANQVFAGFMRQFGYDLPAQAAPSALAPPAADFAQTLARLRWMQRHPERGEVKALYNAALTAAPDAAGLASLLDLLRPVFPAWRRQEQFARLEAALDARAEESDHARVLALRLCVARRDYGRFISRYDMMDQSGMLDSGFYWGKRFKRLRALLTRAPYPDFGAEKLFGIGLPRSGGASLRAALDRLGYLAAHEVNDFSGEMLTDEDAVIFAAMTGLPVSAMFEQLYYRFPEAKFIYTARPYGEWLRSFEAWCERHHHSRDFADIRLTALLSRQRGDHEDFEKTGQALCFRFANARAAHEEFDARVRGFFAAKPGKLLVLEPGRGDEWQALSSFTGKKVPEEPFPWLNKGAR